jgi:hypothetical protein
MNTIVPGRYYLRIDDKHIRSWPHKYLFAIVERYYKICSVPTGFISALRDSDIAILVDEDDEITYFKNCYDFKTVDPDEFTLFKLSSVDL